MSKSHNENIVCPTCGHKQKFQVWDSINASQDPELKEKLLKGDLAEMVCEKCQSHVFVKFDMIYHDLDKKLMVLLRYPDDEGNVPGFDNEALGLVKAMGDDYSLRAVYTYPDLLEKIRIFDDELDDVILEILKYMFSLTNEIPPDDMLLYESTTQNDEGEEQLVLIRPMGKEYMTYNFPVKKLDLLNEPRQFINMDELKEDGVWLNVDRASIANQLVREGS